MMTQRHTRVFKRRLSNAMQAVAVAFMVLIFSGCGLVPDIDSFLNDLDNNEPASSTRNACGGTEQLGSAPGDSCGDCGDGTIVCDGPDSLRCVHATSFNSCGGCERLDHAVGDLCGACGRGEWQCNAQGGVDCVGDDEINACGGCEQLSETVGFACDIGTQRGTWACANVESVVCVGPQYNACGGTWELAAVPGSHCGACHQGRWHCDGREHVVCNDADKGLNACGGCKELAAKRGDSCGQCGGFYVCDGVDNLICSHPQNLCGGCTTLAAGPGESCGQDSSWKCEERENVVCDAQDSTNVCGGDSVLSSQPGEPCGPCESSSRMICTDGELQCVAHAPFNGEEC